MGKLGKVTKSSVLVFLASFLLATQTAFAFAQSVSKGYFTDDQDLKPGMVVQLSDDNTSTESTKVERGKSESSARIIGLATGPDDNFVVIASSQQQVYVQTDGEAFALVSDVNGEVKAGDQLTISPLSGILMKGGESNLINFGTALEDFPNTLAETYSIDGRDADVLQTQVAKVRINLDSRSFASQQQVLSDSTLTSIGEAITGRRVGEARVVVALIIFLVVLVAEGGIIYGAVSSAITSLGRNPLAKTDIRNELVRVASIAVTVLLIGLVVVYGVLRI